VAKTYEAIASHTLSSNAASYEFTSIPGTFTDLIVVCAIDTTKTATGGDSIGIRLNGDTGSNYSTTWLQGDGSSASSTRLSSATEIFIGDASGSENNIRPIIFNVMSYANTNVFKTVLSSFTSSVYLGRTVGLWRDTSAVTSVLVRSYAGSFNLTSGTTLAIFGVKAA